jgi:hypothetical protein
MPDHQLLKGRLRRLATLRQELVEKLKIRQPPNGPERKQSPYLALDPVR